MEIPYVDIHTHRPAGQAVELRAEGIHPWAADEADASLLPAPDPGLQAIGEIGLDYARAVDRNLQEELFRTQLTLAERCRLPVVLHCVRAFEPTMCILKEYTLPGVIFHGFIGSPEQAARALARGYYLSFGLRSFASRKTVEALRTSPLSRLFFETDDDGVEIGTVYGQASELIGVGIDTLKAETLANYERLFGQHNE